MILVDGPSTRVQPDSPGQTANGPSGGSVLTYGELISLRHGPAARLVGARAEAQPSPSDSIDAQGTEAPAA